MLLSMLYGPKCITHVNTYMNFFQYVLMFQMGIADAIVDLVSSGTTLRENNLKEIEGGVVLQSQVSTDSVW